MILLSAGVYLGQRYCFGLQKARQEKLIFEARKASWQQLQQRIRNEIMQFKGEVGLVVKDLETGWELSYDKTKLFPSASLAKIPIMAASFLAAEQGRIRLERNIRLKSSDKLSGSGVLKDMPTGATFSVERLIGLMIYDSDNTATNIVTSLVGIDYLNSAFKAFGLKNTNISRRIADYQSRDKGIENYTTAEDISLLLEKIYLRELGSRRVSEQCIGMLKLTRLNDRIPRYLPVELAIAHKTGLENGVCHDAGIVFAPGADFIIVVLTRHANPNSAPSKDFIARVSFYAYEYSSSSNKGGLP